MGAARWVVIGTALAAAATGTYLLMGPSPQTGSMGSQGSASSPAKPPSIVPQDQIDAESREAMREFLRQSAQDKDVKQAEGSDW